jgi:hypothetical protein
MSGVEVFLNESAADVQSNHDSLKADLLEFLDGDRWEVGGKLSWAFDDARHDDGDTAGELGWLATQYVVATDQERKIINDVFLALCGWTLPTLLRFALENRRERTEADYADDLDRARGARR